MNNMNRPPAQYITSATTTTIATTTTTTTASNANHSIRCNSANGASQHPQPQRGVRKRVMANERERERTKSLNQALEILRNRLPVPEAEKRSKIQTLRMAKEYIEFLTKFTHISPQDQQHAHQQHRQDNRHTCNETRQYNDIKPQQPLITSSGMLQKHHHHHHQQPDSPLTYKFYKFRLNSSHHHHHHHNHQQQQHQHQQHTD